MVQQAPGNNSNGVITANSYQQSSTAYSTCQAMQPGSYQPLHQQQQQLQVQQPAVEYQVIQTQLPHALYAAATPSGCPLEQNKQVQYQQQAQHTQLQTQLVPAQVQQPGASQYTADQLALAAQGMQLQLQQQQPAVLQLMPSQTQQANTTYIYQNQAAVSYSAPMDLQQQQVVTAAPSQEPAVTFSYAYDPNQPAGYTYSATAPATGGCSFTVPQGASMMEVSRAQGVADYVQGEVLYVAGSSGMLEVASQEVQGSVAYEVRYAPEPQQLLLSQPSGSSMMSCFTGTTAGQQLMSFQSAGSIEAAAAVQPAAFAADGTYVTSCSMEHAQGYGVTQEDLGPFASQQPLDGTGWQN